MVGLTKCIHQNLLSLAVNKLDKNFYSNLWLEETEMRLKVVLLVTKLLLNWLILLFTTDVLRESFY